MRNPPANSNHRPQRAHPEQRERNEVRQRAFHPVDARQDVMAHFVRAENEDQGRAEDTRSLHRLLRRRAAAEVEQKAGEGGERGQSEQRAIEEWPISRSKEARGHEGARLYLKMLESTCAVNFTSGMIRW